MRRDEKRAARLGEGVVQFPYNCPRQAIAAPLTIGDVVVEAAVHARPEASSVKPSPLLADAIVHRFFRDEPHQRLLGAIDIGQLRVFGVTHRLRCKPRHFVAWQSKVAVELGERLQEAAGIQ